MTISGQAVSTYIESPSEPLSIKHGFNVKDQKCQLSGDLLLDKPVSIVLISLPKV